MSLSNFYSKMTAGEYELEKEAHELEKLAAEEEAAGRITARGFMDELYKLANQPANTPTTNYIAQKPNFIERRLGVKTRYRAEPVKKQSTFTTAKRQMKAHKSRRVGDIRSIRSQRLNQAYNAR